MLAKASKIVSVRSGAKSKMYAFCFWNTCPERSKVQGFCARNAACMYWAGDDRFESMMTAVHSGTVTPVVSCPTDRVMVLPSDFSASSMAVRTLSRDLPTATASVSSSAPVAGGQDDRVVLEDVVLLEELLQGLRGGDAVEQPEGVADLVAHLGGGERVLLVGRHAVEEPDDLGLVLEEPVVLGCEELVEIERVIDVRLVLVDGDALG